MSGGATNQEIGSVIGKHFKNITKDVDPATLAQFRAGTVPPEDNRDMVFDEITMTSMQSGGVGNRIGAIYDYSDK